MKKLFFWALAAMALVACQKGYTLSGECGTLNGQAKLSYGLPDGTPFSEETELKDGKFSFKGETPDVLEATVTLTPEGGDPIRARLYIENARIHMIINPEKIVDYAKYGGKVFSDVSVSGGRSNEFNNALEKAREEVNQLPEFKDLAAAQEELSAMGYVDMAAYDAKRDEISKRFADVRSEYAKKLREASSLCIKQFPDAEAAALMYYIYDNEKPFEEFEAGFNQFTEKVRESFLATRVREELVARRATQPGAEAPDFTLNDPDGKPVTLSQLRGQYVIVDFWASWCKPCRAGVPAMKELYAKYHDKGLEILGVSDDSNHDAWKKALEEDQTAWIHVVDEFPEKNKPSRVGTLYGVHYIPSYFLLDKEGKVIGKMNHEELEAKLAELLD